METHFTTYFDTADNFFTWRWRVEESEGFKFQHEDLLEIIHEDVLQIIQIHSILQTPKKGEKKVAGGVQFRQKNVWKWILSKFFGIAMSHVYIDMKMEKLRYL